MNHHLQHLGTLCKYTGISFIAGAVNHGFFSGQRSVITAAIGAAMYVVGGILLRQQSPNVSWSQLLGWGVVASIGLGFFTGGLQHFPDSPSRSAWVVPLGFFMFALAFAFSELTDASQRPKYTRYALLLGSVITLACIVAAKTMPPGAFDTDHHGKPKATSNDDHGSHDHGGHGAEKPASATAANPATPPTRQVEIIMTDNMRFTPQNIVVKQGETIEFVLKNTGKVQHEWVFGQEDELNQHAKEMQTAATHAAQGHAHGDMQGHGTTIQGTRVPAGQTQNLKITFEKTGTFRIACFEAGHYEAGMQGLLTVTP